MDNQSDVTKGDNAKSKKGRVVIFVRNMSFCPVRYLYQASSKYSEGSLTNRAGTKSMDNHCQT